MNDTLVRATRSPGVDPEGTLLNDWLTGNSVTVTFSKTGTTFSIMSMPGGVEHYWTYTAPEGTSFESAAGLARRDYLKS
jgi:hypothetical protein